MRKTALQGSSRPDLITDRPRPAIIGMNVRHTTCNGRATVDVTLENYGGTSTMGTLKVYADGREGESTTVDLDPYYPETLTLTVPAGPGNHTIKAVLTYPGGSDSMSETVTLLKDSDCDYLSDQEEYEYGTNPFNRDTDGDGVIDSLDMNPVGNYMVTVYILRAKALDDVDSSLTGHNPADMSLDVTADGKEKTLLLTDNQDDREKKILPAFNPLANIENYTIAKATFDVPDGRAIIPITFHLYDRDNDDGTERTEMDVSPGPGSVATIYYDLRTGRWWGDDYPGDENHYFGYGHLSGCGDGSCGIGPKEPEKDLKIYAKYESILQKKGISGEVLRLYHVENSTQVQWESGGGLILVKNPRKVLIAEVLLGNGSLINVTLVNTYNARVIRLRQIKLPAKPDAPLSGANLTKAGVEMNASALTDSGEVKLPAKVVAYSSRGEHDGEVWFVILPNDPDGMPFWREVELNRELKEQGLSPSFDPSDGYMIGGYEPGIAESLNEMDELGDYDGDGVPNAVEQLIGKDPAKRDVLGIQLSVSVEWRMSEEGREKLAYSIRKASDFVYDYTDGYAMITKVTIWDDKKNWEKADIQIHNGSCIVGLWNKKICPKTSSVGGYWVHMDMGIPEKFRLNVAIEMPREFASLLRNMEHLKEYITECTLRYGLTPEYIEPCVLSKLGRDKVKIGSVDYGKALAHELGHYVFILGDEYMDWKVRNYYTYDLFDPTKLIFRSDAWWFYTNNVPPHSIMNNAYKYSELSWPADYERFKAKLIERFGDNWEEHMTDQWGRWKECSRETLSHLLSGNLQFTFRMDNSTVTIRPNRAGIEFLLSDTPNTGPYTGVGYFMEVSWR